MKFIEVLTQFDIPNRPSGHHHCREGWVQIDCPFCGKDSQNFHMGYSITGRYFNCWRCGHHPTIEVIMELTGLPKTKSKTLLRKLDVTEKEIAVKPRGRYTPPSGIKELHAAHKHYLRERGYDYSALTKLWGIKGIGIAKILQWRIFIPIHHKGEVVSWSTRSLSNQGIRYISAPPNLETIHHKSILYGQDYARHSIIVCEGPLDVWKLGKGAVATFGTNFTQEQVAQIAKYPRRAICFDNEKTAQKMAKILCNLLSPLPGTTYNITLKCKDVGEANSSIIHKLRGRFLDG